MRRMAWVAVLLGVMVFSLSAQESWMDACDLRGDQDHTEWISQVMQSIATLKPGMTRRDLAPLLREEGGLSTRSRRTYVYQHCPYVKVEVEFVPLQGARDENPDDKIIKISRPFLEYSIYD